MNAVLLLPLHHQQHPSATKKTTLMITSALSPNSSSSSFLTSSSPSSSSSSVAVAISAEPAPNLLHQQQQKSQTAANQRMELEQVRKVEEQLAEELGLGQHQERPSTKLLTAESVVVAADNRMEGACSNIQQQICSFSTNKQWHGQQQMKKEQITSMAARVAQRNCRKLPLFWPMLFLLSFLWQISEMAEARLLDTSVACDQHNFILSLNFDMPFRGLVYSEEGFPNCIYVNGTMLSHLNYQLKVPLHGCETRINTDGNFENGIIIQENMAFLQATDKKYLLTCIPSGPPPPPSTSTSSQSASATPSSNNNNGIEPMTFIAPPMAAVTLPPKASSNTGAEPAFGRENSVTVDFGGVTVDQSLTSPELVRGTLPPSLGGANSAETVSAVPELKYTVEIRAGHAIDAGPISTALNIGDPISYVVRLQKPVSESQIGRCWASDSKSSLELSDEHGCSLQPRGNIWGPFERVDSPNEIVFVNRIKAWAFPTSNEVNIFCNLRVCMSRHCSFNTNCSDVTHQHEQNERRRREGGGFEEIETLKTSIRFRPKRHSQQLGKDEEAKTEDFAASLLRTYPELFEEAESWCLSLSQLLLVGACCCLASICLTVAATFLVFTHFCQDNGKLARDRGKHQRATEIDIWTMVNELKRRNQQQQQQQKQAVAIPPSRDNNNRSSRHAV